MILVIFRNFLEARVVYCLLPEFNVLPSRMECFNSLEQAPCVLKEKEVYYGGNCYITQGPSLFPVPLGHWLSALQKDRHHCHVGSPPPEQNQPFTGLLKCFFPSPWDRAAWLATQSGKSLLAQGIPLTVMLCSCKAQGGLACA